MWEKIPDSPLPHNFNAGLMELGRLVTRLHKIWTLGFCDLQYKQYGESFSLLFILQAQTKAPEATYSAYHHCLPTSTDASARTPCSWCTSGGEWAALLLVGPRLPMCIKVGHQWWAFMWVSLVDELSWWRKTFTLEHLLTVRHTHIYIMQVYNRVNDQVTEAVLTQECW